MIKIINIILAGTVLLADYPLIAVILDSYIEVLLMLKYWIFILFSMGPLNFGLCHGAEPDPLRLILGQVSYIGTDYPAAVKDGEVINQDEYREMIEFSETVIRQFSIVREQISAEDASLIQEQLVELKHIISQKGSDSRIAEISQDLARQIALKFEIPVAPDNHPLMVLGNHVYTHHCAVCHGEKGLGDGPGGFNREPPPRDFFDEEVMNVSSPFKFYNILLTGVEGTDMQGYKSILSEDELWSVSFYLSSLRFHDASVPLNENQLHAGWKQRENILSQLLQSGLDKTLLASLGDLELKGWLSDVFASDDLGSQELTEIFSLLRTSAPFLKDIPLNKDHHQSASSPDGILDRLNVTITKCQSAGKSAINGDFKLAESLLLDAYLNGFESTEKSLALLDRSFVSDVERLFMDARGYARKGDFHAFSASHQKLLETLERARETYSTHLNNKSESGWGDFISSFVIIVREGLEAFLVVAALLALLSSMGAVNAHRWVHAGWLSALVAGGVTFWIFEKVLLLSGAAKESVEAICTGIAAIMLFYTGFWLISQFEHKKWNRFVKEQTKKALSTGRLWGLFSIAFIAVYREAAETVLFYSALYSGAGSPLAVSMGFIAGSALLLGVCWGIIRFNLRLPLRQFFMVTSLLMVMISIVLAGKTVHEVIEAGLLNPTPVSWMPSIDLLGIYPSLETLLAQFTLVSVGGVIAYVLSRKKVSGDTAS